MNPCRQKPLTLWRIMRRPHEQRLRPLRGDIDASKRHEHANALHKAALGHAGRGCGAAGRSRARAVHECFSKVIRVLRRPDSSQALAAGGGRAGRWSVGRILSEIELVALNR